MVSIALSLINYWAKAAERYWTIPVGREHLGIYGTGYNGWGVQTQQKFAAVLATLCAKSKELSDIDTNWALERSLAALRYNLESHKTGRFHCADGSRWGNTWISALGVERMMFGVHHLGPYLSASDQDALRNMLCNEADWLLHDYPSRAKPRHQSVTLGT